MRILVTGGTGLVGSAVCARLVAEGAEPVAYDIGPQPVQLGSLANKVPIERGDILDLPSLLRAIRSHRIEAVIHTAAMLTAAVVPNPWQGIHVNYVGTVHILEASRLEGVRRVVFCSSSTVYDSAAVQDRPIREADPVLPRTIYATTKLACEHTGRNYAEQYGVDFVACRFAQVYGPGRSQSGAASLWMAPLLHSLVRRGRARVAPPSHPAAEYLYSEDAAQALVRAALAERLPHRVYNIGDGQLTRFDEMIAILHRLLPGVEVEVAGERITSYYAEWFHPMDQTLARAELGYRPEFPPPAGLQRCIDSIRTERSHAAV